ncbi:hypothetical protein QTH90_03605 [Variovorax sp. J2P1-59]|uniref:hypothetical protein n=1 Tax=Variovorax flavidus TaxID=3053501 RepID=UPI002577F16F|nr:hypothetical protein [Variovorax sp. J2P1-59]MDM0073451.1 hypothetical protein [Variovorax sp. J2P1-59]
MSRTIRSVDDLAQLPDDELLACLGQLRAAIHEAKRKHAAARREARISADTAFEFHVFEWRPKGPQRLDAPIKLSPQTPVEEIPVRASAREALCKLNIFCVEDLSAISEQELMMKEAIGAKTVNRLREVLARVGLDFLSNPTAEMTACEGLRKSMNPGDVRAARNE